MQKNKDGLEAPTEYWEMSEEELQQAVNQCGPDGPVNDLIPDHLFGLKIHDACDIHDITFAKARNQADHQKSDRLFLKNMNNRIEKGSKTYFGKVVRKTLAMVFFLAVRVYSSFQKDKENEVMHF